MGDFARKSRALYFVRDLVLLTYVLLFTSFPLPVGGEQQGRGRVRAPPRSYFATSSPIIIGQSAAPGQAPFSEPNDAPGPALEVDRPVDLDEAHSGCALLEGGRQVPSPDDGAEAIGPRNDAVRAVIVIR